MTNKAFWQILMVLMLCAAPSFAQDKTAFGSKIMVVSAHDDATRIGYEVLKGGGSAADAALAVQLTLGLVEPQASGIGGGSIALFYHAATKQVHTFDGRETAPVGAGKYLFRDKDGKPMEFIDAAVGGRAVGVPGTLKMLHMMQKRFGKKAWRDLFSPTIALSENGFIVSKRLADAAGNEGDNLHYFNDSFLYLYPDAATPVEAGQRLKNPLYAKTLREIAMNGTDAFYKGPLAEVMVKRVREDRDNPGLLSLEDLAGYTPIERRSVCKTYRGYLVCTAGAPSSGGMVVLSALGILSNFDLRSMGAQNVDAWHAMMEAERLAIADKNYYMADPEFVDFSGDRLLDTNYLRGRAALIAKDKVNPAVTHGVFGGAPQKKQSAEAVYPKPPGTSHITIVDADGNIVSMTSSIQDTFGSRISAGGVFLNNQLTEFSFISDANGAPIANRVEGGKRPLAHFAPMIIFTPQGAPYLTIGSAGGSAIAGFVLQRIVAMIDWQMDAVSAISAPAIINRGAGVEAESGGEVISESLRAKGHPVETKGILSGISAIFFNGNAMTGIADPRREGSAMGE